MDLKKGRKQIIFFSQKKISWCCIERITIEEKQKTEGLKPVKEQIDLLIKLGTSNMKLEE